MILLDTDILIDIQRGFQPAVDWFSTLNEPALIAGYTKMELLDQAQNLHQVRQSLKLTTPFQVVWPSEHACNEAISLFIGFHLSHGLGLLDSLIAVTARELDAALQTFNQKHYRMVPGLAIAEPYLRQ